MTRKANSERGILKAFKKGVTRRRVAILVLLFIVLSAPLTTASATTVTIGEFYSESDVTAPIMINEVRNLSAVSVKLTFDPSVITISNAKQGDLPSFIANLEHTDEGWVKIVAYTTADAGLSGDIKLADLTISPIGSYGAYSTLDIEVETLFDTEYRTIDAEVIDGFFYIGEIFSTGTGTYPSISGIHNGTITLIHNIDISRMYTYPCPGTGGYTEYAAILHSNGTVIAEAHWNGYTGDWRNLSFNKSFTLYANETYNYTIRTGSYPQIIHAPSHNATGGVITCMEFVDINGKRYEGWIPAIRLS